MPVFEYKGVDTQSKNVSGTVDADSEKNARAKLRRQKIFPTKLVPEGSSSSLKNIKLFQKVKVEDIATMSRQLAVLLNAKIPLIDSLEAIIDQVENPIIRKALSEIKEKVSEGARLGDCMQSYPKVFDNIYIHMVSAGEASGSLDVVLDRLADYKEGQADLKSKVKSAMMYPLIMTLVSIAMLAYLFTNVVPEITAVIVKQKITLPLPTRIVMGITYVLQNYWFITFIVFALVAFIVWRWIKSPKGQLKIDEWALKAPLFGALNLKIAVARFSRTLSTLLNSGVQLLPGLEIVKNVMDNKILEDVVSEVMVSVKEGESLAEPLKRSGKFPSMFLHMVRVGEKTGMLESMLERVANSYDKEVSDYVDGMTSIMTPIMLVVMGGVIGFIVFAVLMPILQLTQSQ
jgi:general secretion pathway protein F